MNRSESCANITPQCMLLLYVLDTLNMTRVLVDQSLTSNYIAARSIIEIAKAWVAFI
jgi:hypothetical protein